MNWNFNGYVKICGTTTFTTIFIIDGYSLRWVEWQFYTGLLSTKVSDKSYFGISNILQQEGVLAVTITFPAHVIGFILDLHNSVLMSLIPQFQLFGIEVCFCCCSFCVILQNCTLHIFFSQEILTEFRSLQKGIILWGHSKVISVSSTVWVSHDIIEHLIYFPLTSMLFKITTAVWWVVILRILMAFTDCLMWYMPNENHRWNSCLASMQVQIAN